MVIFGALFAFIIYLVIALLGGGLLGLFIGVAIVVVYALFVYFYGSRMVLKMSKAQIADKKQYSQLYSIVEELALQRNCRCLQCI